MGQVLTKVYSLAAREVKMFNIENRAEKVISREKPIPAPKHPSTLLELQRLKEENISKEYLSEKNNQLDGYLKNVYVTTPQPKPKKVEKNPDQRPLPQNRFIPNESVYGYSESEEKNVPVGRLSLKQALQLVADHRTDPQMHSNTSIAAQYKLPVTLTDDILNHFKLFEVHWESKKKDPAKQSSYQKLQQRVEEMNALTASDIIKNSPFFRKKPLFKNKNEEEKKDEKNINISIDNNNSYQKDDKKKR